MKRILIVIFLFMVAAALLYFSLFQSREAWERVEKTGELRWGADISGGAPYVFQDPQNPDRVIGFEVEIMAAVARRLSVRPKLVNVAWDHLVPALLRNDFDLAFNGLEITPARERSIDFTVPYYYFSEQITVRKEDSRLSTLAALRGRRVGVLSTALAQNILEKDGRITVVPYPSPVEAYKDLEIGRLDAAFQDLPIAAWYVTPNPRLLNVGAPVGEGIYAGGVRKDSPLLKSKINAALSELIESGELEAIYRKWQMWTKNQAKLKLAARQGVRTGGTGVSLKKYLPLLAKGAAMTLLISSCAMLLAVITGFALCLGKLYGPKVIRFICSSYIELIRGTPLLVQLYLLYYGLPNLGLQLNALTAAILGMGLNYAAYEAEIYRAGILSVPKGQDEAARSLGMSGWQSFRYILLPQAARTILPPSTNDFIALFKDTSLVSIITVTELTHAYTQAATSTYRFLELGLMTAALYFLMSFPLSLWSSALERERHVTMH